MLTSLESSTVDEPEMTQMSLLCVAPLSDVEFQLRQGEREMKVLMVSTSPERASFYLKLSDMGDHGPFTCRYRLNRMTAWSEDSKPVQLMWSDGKPHRRAEDQSRIGRHRWWSEKSRMGTPKQNLQTQKIIQSASASQASGRTINTETFETCKELGHLK